MVKMRGGVNGDEEFDEAGRDDDVEKASDGEFPVVVGRDGSGNDDGSCIDGRGSEEDDETTGVSGCDNDNGNENFNVLHVRSRQHTD